MFNKIFFLLILYLEMLLYDIPKLKQRNRRERISYGILIIPIIYLSLIYIMDLSWPTLDKLVHFFFFKPAQQIVKLMTTNM
ncbi:hypothetical protein CON35_25055 [Bacillus cereus]|nr:hypothetical protein CON35_25055 [Bacillus cereus]